MVSNLGSSNNQHLNAIQEEILNATAFESLLGQDKTTQQEKLKQIFTIISDNNVTKAEKLKLQKGAENLLGKLDTLEKKLAYLKSKMDEKEDEINKKADETARIIAAVNTKSSKMENNQRSIVKNCISDVFYMYGRNQIGKDEISGEIKKRVRNSSYKLGSQREIEELLDTLDNRKADIDKLTSGATQLIDYKNVLQKQYGVTKSACNLINKTLSQIGNTDTNYTNSDYDVKIPVYSINKTDIVSDLFVNEKYNVVSTNTDFGNSNIISEKDIKDKYSKYFALTDTTASGKDSYSGDNPAFAKLNNAINAGLLDDLKNSNMTSSQIAEFFANNYKGANISYNNDKNQIVIPYGHGTFAAGVCSNLSNFITEVNSTNRYVKNTWNKDQGNTISSNAQIAALKENYGTVIDQLASKTPKFSFKEAMYALFDKDNGLFKNTGILYDTSKQNSKLSYTIDAPGDKETADLYKNVAAKIKEKWGVDATYIDSKLGIERSSQEEPTPASPQRIDPITFKMGDTEYAFLIDKNKDGSFTNTNEFIGGQQGKSWLDDLKSLDADGDGKLAGDELKNLKILGSKYTDNASTKTDNGKLHATTNNIEYLMTNAKDMGIEEINLFGLENQVNLGTNKTDINGSEIFNDSFTFKLNGQDVTASRKDDTSEFMKTVYGDAQGKNFQIGLSDSEAQKQIDIGYKEIDDFISEHEETFQNLEMLTNYDSLRGETRAMYKSVNDRITNDENALLLRASNRAAALGHADSWTSIESEVIEIANSEGISIDMEQAKGIYMIDGSLDANGIVEKYKQQNEKYESIENERQNSTIAWEALIKCYKNGITTTASEINKILAEGKASSVDEVVKVLQEQNDTKA